MFSLYIMFNNFKNLSLTPLSTDSSVFPKYLCLCMHVCVGRGRCLFPSFCCCCGVFLVCGVCVCVLREGEH